MTLYHIIIVIIIVIAVAVSVSWIIFSVILDEFHPHREHIKSNSLLNQMNAIIL